MAYQKNTWEDRTGVGLNKFTDQDGKLYEFTPTPDSITSVGTPFSAAWMNHIEEGIANIYKYGTTLPSSGSEGDLFFLIEA
jgi:hypothetical protein